MGWANFLGGLAADAARDYVNKRGIDGIIEDAGSLKDKVTGMLSNSSSQANIKTENSRRTNYEGQYKDDEEGINIEAYQELANGTIAEMKSNFREAKKYDINSMEFHENACFAIITGYRMIDQLTEVDEDLDYFEDQVNEIDSLCDEIIEYIVEKCQGGMNAPKNIILGNNTNNFGMKVYCAYPVNLQSASTILVGVCVNGIIHAGDSIDFSEYDDDINAEVSFIGMFGKKIETAECGDVCAVFLDEECFDVLPGGEFFIGEEPNVDKKKSTDTPISEYEKEYLDEYMACVTNDGTVSAKERRLLNRLRDSLNISEERASELEASFKANSLTQEELEYADEVKACLEDDGGITDKERRLLNRLAKSLGIAAERAIQIENMLIK